MRYVSTKIAPRASHPRFARPVKRNSGARVVTLELPKLGGQYLHMSFQFPQASE